MKKVYLQIMQIFGLIVFLSVVFGALAIHVNAAPTANLGDIIINEIMNNPAAVGDTEGEWIEIVNISGGSIDIDGWTLEDDGGDSHTISNGGPLNVNPGDYFVLCRNGDNSLNGGVSCDYTYGPGFDFELTNGADEVILFEGLTEISRVEYDGGTDWPDPTGASMNYNSPFGGTTASTNNVGANWNTSTTAFGDGDLGTPGTINEDWMGPTAVSLQNFSTTTTPSIGLIVTLLLASIGAATLFVLWRSKKA